MAPTTRRTAIVRWLKIVLPLIAVALLASVFLIDGDTIDMDIPQLAESPQGGRTTQSVIDADYSGLTEGDEPYRLLAEEARQVPEGTLLTVPMLVIETERNGEVRMAARDGAFGEDLARLDLTGDVAIDVERQAISLRSQDLRVGLEDGSFSILSPLTLAFEGGSLRANAARGPARDATDDTVWFEGDVRLFLDTTPLPTESSDP